MTAPLLPRHDLVGPALANLVALAGPSPDAIAAAYARLPRGAQLAIWTQLLAALERREGAR